MLSPFVALVFDLDGTITDSKPGILGCLRKTLDAYHINLPEPLDRFVGPPVEEWAVELLPRANEESRADFACYYRACYDREGWKNNAVFTGVRELLTLLRQEGFLLYICTSKQQHFALRILDLFDIEAAHANHILCLAAGWGYGTADEYALADAIAAAPADVAGLVCLDHSGHFPELVRQSAP
jgi:phosphoglycolate phosphatase